MKKGILSIVVIICLLCATFISAESNSTVKSDKKHTSSSIVVFNNLSLAIDFWHDATLKSDTKAISENIQIIFDIINDDIKDSHQAITYAKLDVSYSDESSDKLSKNDKLKKFDGVLSTKKLLYASLKKSKSFSYSYRLLADYQAILKQDIDAHKVHIADSDDNNAGQAKFIK